MPHPAIVCPTTRLETGTDGRITWQPLTLAQREGYFDVAPGTNVVTCVAAYYWNAPGAPATSAITDSNWVLASGGPHGRTGYVTFCGTASSNPDPGTMMIYLPSDAPTPTYLALELYFDCATPDSSTFLRTDFLSDAWAYQTCPPTAASIFARTRASSDGAGVTVTWQSDVESNVAAYEVYWSPTPAGPFDLVCTPALAPKGNNSGYSVTFENPSVEVRELYVKVRAVLMDGTFEESPSLLVQGEGRQVTPLPAPGERDSS
jgi:hypothetical protein